MSSSLFALGQKLLASRPVHCGAQAQESRVFLQFPHELVPVEIAALREYVVESLRSSERDLFLAGFCHVPARLSAVPGEKRTRLLFKVRAAEQDERAAATDVAKELEALLAPQNA